MFKHLLIAALVLSSGSNFLFAETCGEEEVKYVEEYLKIMQGRDAISTPHHLLGAQLAVMGVHLCAKKIKVSEYCKTFGPLLEKYKEVVEDRSKFSGEHYLRLSVLRGMIDYKTNCPITSQKK